MRIRMTWGFVHGLLVRQLGELPTPEELSDWSHTPTGRQVFPCGLDHEQAFFVLSQDPDDRVPEDSFGN